MPHPNDHSHLSDPLGEPPRTGRFWFDLLAASAAIFISVVSLVVAIRGEHTQRGLLAANSWPFVQLSVDQGSAMTKLDIENAGVGPAKIKSFEVFYNGKPADNAFELLRQCCGVKPAVPGKAPDPIDGFSYGGVANNVLRQGEHIVALSIAKVPQSMPVYERFTKEVSNLTFRICYCSALDECWNSNMRDLVQVPVQSCKVPEHQFSDGAGP